MDEHILTDAKTITIYDTQRGIEIAVITPDTVTTASPEIVVKLSY